ncbi:MAG: hypothetical protein PHC34_11135 [Candidatus Gastranaerophilales bacterium]|nr:hypothetical protein [Candidatus Gastranaerophilales bacterium]
MTESENSFIRWHDEDVVVGKCIKMLENIEESIKRQTATFLVDEMIAKLPYTTMPPEELYNLTVSSETRKRRWYDIDEVIRLFVELLKHCTPETRKEIAIKAINFMESLTLDTSKSIALVDPEENTKYFYGS